MVGVDGVGQGEKTFRTSIRLVKAAWGSDDPDLRRATKDLNELLANGAP